MPALFTAYYYPSILVTDAGFSYLPLTFEDGVEACVPVGMTALAINIYSPDRDLATAFLECMMDDIETIDRAEMMPHYPEVLIRPDDYGDMVLAAQQQLAQIEARYEEAEGDEKENYAQILVEMQEAINALDEYYITSEESVAAYRAAMQNLSLYPNCDQQNGTVEAIDRFATYEQQMLLGQISVDDFIDFLVTTREMKQQEDQ